MRVYLRNQHNVFSKKEKIEAFEEENADEETETLRLDFLFFNFLVQLHKVVSEVKKQFGILNLRKQLKAVSHVLFESKKFIVLYLLINHYKITLFNFECH